MVNATGLEPVCVALLVSDYVHMDPISARYAILGPFQEIIASEFPASYSALGVYAALTDGRGTAAITVQMVDVDEEREPLWEYSTEVDLSDPQFVFELGLNIQDVEFVVPGIYRLQLVVDRATIMERSIKVVLERSGQE